MLNSSKIMAEILLGITIVGSSFPTQTKEIQTTVNNSSSFFITPIQIKKDDNLATMNFAKIFGDNPTDENANNIQSINYDMYFKILNTTDEGIYIFKMGDKTIVINPGSNHNSRLLLEELGRMQVNKIDAIILTDIKKSTDNLHTLVEMGLSKLVLLPNIQIQKNTQSLELVQNLKDLKDKIKSKGADINDLNDQTKINFSRSTITTFLPDNVDNISLQIENNENTIFIIGNLPEVVQRSANLKASNSVILEQSNSITKEILTKLNPEKLYIITNSKEDEINNNNEKTKLIEQAVNKDKISLITNVSNGIIQMINNQNKFEYKVESVIQQPANNTDNSNNRN